MLGVRTLNSGFLARWTDICSKHVFTRVLLPSAFGLSLPLGWEPTPWLTSRLVDRATRQLESQYQVQSALIARPLIPVSPQHSCCLFSEPPHCIWQAG